MAAGRTRMGQALFEDSKKDDLPPHLINRYRDDDELMSAAVTSASEAKAPPTEEDVDDAPRAELVPQKQKAKSKLKFKRTTGSYKEPYVKDDGTEMAKWGLHVTIEFVDQYKWFIGHLKLGESGSEFVMRAVREKMRREMARRKQQGEWKNYEDLFSGP